MQNALTMFTCPVCDAENELTYQVETHEIVDCIDCSSELEVTSTDPVSVVEIDMDAEDWGQ